MPVKDKESELAVQLQEVKARASELSGEVVRQSKLLGAAQDKLDKYAVLDADLKQMDVDLGDAQKQITRLERQLKEAQQLADNGQKAVDAGKLIAAGLAQLKSL